MNSTKNSANGILRNAKKRLFRLRKRIICFTLIELLVVVAIIAILMAILLPSLNSARLRGKAIQCMNDLKTIGSALSEYAIDYDGWCPVVAQTDSLDNNPPIRCNWYEDINPLYSHRYVYYNDHPIGIGRLYPSYISIYSIFYCPDTLTSLMTDPTNGWAATWEQTGQTCSITYFLRGYRDYNYTVPGSSGGIQRLKNGRSNVAIIGEYQILSSENTVLSHRGRGMNVMYGDLHATWSKAGKRATGFPGSDTYRIYSFYWCIFDY